MESTDHGTAGGRGPVPFDRAEDYREAGWTHTLPLPAGVKSPPPAGFTGRDGAAVTVDSIDRWRRAGWRDRDGHYMPGNIALRLPAAIIGLDVDHYDGKRGGDTLADLEAEHGPLPATWRSTSRDDGTSGIRLYRVPVVVDGWPTGAGDGIEFIRWGHRYAVVWPSVHPTGSTYRWIRPDGTTADDGELPPYADLPSLPDAWVAEFTGVGAVATRSPGRTRRQSKEVTEQWLREVPAGEPCRQVAQILADARGVLRQTAGGRHDGITRRVGELANAAQVGHPGVPLALQHLRGAFAETLGPARGGTLEAEAEFDRIVDGAVGLVLDRPSDRAGRGCDCPQPQGEARRYNVGVRDVVDVEAEGIAWLWPGRLPRAKVVVLDGDPGTGKSVLTLDLAARITNGHGWPDGQPTDVTGPVLILSAEDGPEDTIKPRLLAANADVRQVRLLTEITDPGAQQARPLDLVTDVPAIEQEIRRLAAVLVVIDPLMAFLGEGTDSHKDQQIRRVLAPLARVAHDTDAPVIVVRHLNKTAGGNPLYRGGGSIGIIGAARMGYMVAPDPKDEGRRILACTKSNISALPPSLAYRIAEDPINKCAQVQWVAGTVDVSAVDLCTPPPSEAGEKLTQAAVWLTRYLSGRGGSAPAGETQEAGKAAKHSESALDRARRLLGVTTQRVGFEKGAVWLWSLPASPVGTVGTVGGASQGLTPTAVPTTEAPADKGVTVSVSTQDMTPTTPTTPTQDLSTPLTDGDSQSLDDGQDLPTFPFAAVELPADTAEVEQPTLDPDQDAGPAYDPDPWEADLADAEQAAPDAEQAKLAARAADDAIKIPRGWSRYVALVRCRVCGEPTRIQDPHYRPRHPNCSVPRPPVGLDGEPREDGRQLWTWDAGDGRIGVVEFNPNGWPGRCTPFGTGNPAFDTVERCDSGDAHRDYPNSRRWVEAYQRDHRNRPAVWRYSHWRDGAEDWSRYDCAKHVVAHGGRAWLVFRPIPEEVRDSIAQFTVPAQVCRDIDWDAYRESLNYIVLTVTV